MTATSSRTGSTVRGGGSTGAPQPIASTRTASMVEIRVGAVSASTNGILTFGGDSSCAAHVVHTRWPSAWEGSSRIRRFTIPPSHPTGAMSLPTHRDRTCRSARRRGAGHADALRRRRATGRGPRGSEIVFTSRRIGGSSDLVRRSIAGASTDESLLLRSPEMKIGGNWTDDNRYIVYTGSDPRTKLDLWTLSWRTGNRFRFSDVVQRDARAGVAGWAMDRVCVRRVWRLGGLRADVSGAGREADDFVGGGAEPQWRRDGRELFYLAPEGTLMAVPVSSTDETFDAGRAVPLFQARIPADILAFRNHYAPSETARGSWWMQPTITNP